MDRHARKCLENWVITVESSRERHQEIILSTVARRAYEIFERRGCQHGFHLDDWAAAEKELLRDDFDGNTSQFHFLIACPQDPEVTTVLSLTTQSLIVFHNDARHVGKRENGLDVNSVHVLPEEIDPSQADVTVVEGLLHVYMPKKNNHRKPS